MGIYIRTKIEKNSIPVLRGGKGRGWVAGSRSCIEGENRNPTPVFFFTRPETMKSNFGTVTSHHIQGHRVDRHVKSLHWR
jgi:hypothetical protein